MTKKKCKIKCSAFNHSLHETIYVHCLRSTEKDALNIEIWVLVCYTFVVILNIGILDHV